MIGPAFPLLCMVLVRIWLSFDKVRLPAVAFTVMAPASLSILVWPRMADWLSVMDGAVNEMDPKSNEPFRLMMFAPLDIKMNSSARMRIVPPVDAPVSLSICPPASVGTI